MSVKDIARTHRLGKRHENAEKPRPIIVRFPTYRQRKQVFDVKKKLKGQKIVITENLTKKRYKLLQKCIETFGRDKTWSFDGRINVATDDGRKVFITMEDLERYLGE